MQKKIKLVVDTNIWISWLIGKKQTPLNKILLDENIELFSSEEQIKELFEVMERSKFHKYFSKSVIEEFKIYFREAVTITKVKNKVKLSRDADDDFLLSLVATINAAYLITGDSDLLIIKKFKRTEIISLSQFLNL